MERRKSSLVFLVDKFQGQTRGYIVRKSDASGLDYVINSNDMQIQFFKRTTIVII